MPLSSYLNSHPVLSDSKYVHQSAQVIGDVQIGSHSSIWCNTVLRGDECLIGMGSIVMDDVVIEKQVIVGAGSLVPPGKVLESGFLYVGRPAIQVCALREDEIAFLKYSAEHYVRVKENHMSPRP